jgi:hypothetical protein
MFKALEIHAVSSKFSPAISLMQGFQDPRYQINASQMRGTWNLAQRQPKDYLPLHTVTQNAAARVVLPLSVHLREVLEWPSFRHQLEEIEPSHISM